MSSSERIQALDVGGANVGRDVAMHEDALLRGEYRVTCVGADGAPKWTDTIHNLVTTVGKNDLLDKYLAGSAYTAAWYLGLIDSGSYSGVAAGDTSASHSGWTESTAYSNGTRPAPSWGAASGGSKASTATGFSINASATIKGAFLIGNSTKGGTTGVLYSCGLFSGGDKAVGNGDTLNVTYTAGA